jgi:hypothetical protein
LKFPWITRRTLAETESGTREAIGICNRAFALVESLQKENEQLRGSLLVQTVKVDVQESEFSAMYRNLRYELAQQEKVSPCKKKS